MGVFGPLGVIRYAKPPPHTRTHPPTQEFCRVIVWVSDALSVFSGYGCVDFGLFSREGPIREFYLKRMEVIK